MDDEERRKARNASKARYQRKLRREGRYPYTVVTLRLRIGRDDAMIAWLDSKENKNEYLMSLISRDMGK